MAKKNLGLLGKLLLWWHVAVPGGQFLVHNNYSYLQLLLRSQQLCAKHTY